MSDKENSLLFAWEMLEQIEETRTMLDKAQLLINQKHAELDKLQVSIIENYGPNIIKEMCAASIPQNAAETSNVVNLNDFKR